MKFQELVTAINNFVSQEKNGVVVLYGPTASGKSSLSIRLAQYFSSQQKKTIEIISADSRQVYRSMNIGTDKIPQEYREKIQHHGIDLVDPDDKYTAYQRQQQTKQHIKNIQKRGNIAMIVGGTGLYIDTIYKNFSLIPDVDPDRSRRKELTKQEINNPGSLWNRLQKIDSESAKTLHPNNIRYIIRALEIHEQTGLPKSELAQEHDPEWPLLMLHLNPPKTPLEQKITKRVREMIEEGLIEEVNSLLDSGYTGDHQAMNGIGYKQTIERLEEGSNDTEKLIESISLATRRYAKRQRSRFRRYIHDANNKPKSDVSYVNIDNKIT